MKNLLQNFANFIDAYAIWIAVVQLCIITFSLVLGKETISIYNGILLSVIWIMVEFQKKQLDARVKELENK